MPDNSLDAVRDALFAPRFARVVPLVAVFDESDFATASRREFGYLQTREVDAVIRAGTFGDGPALLEETLQQGFGLSIAPLKLIENQPPWLCCFADAGTPEASSVPALAERIKGIRDAFQMPPNTIVFLRVDEASDADSMVEAMADSKDSLTLFLLGEKGQVVRTPEILAEGAAYLALAGWERFCTGDSLSLDSAFLLDGRVSTREHVLGMGCLGVDVSYHAPRLAKRVTERCVASWSAEGAVAGMEVQPLGTGLETAKKLIPRLGYRVSEGRAGTPGAPGFQVGPNSLELWWTTPQEFNPPQGASEKDGMRRYLSTVKDAYAFMTGVVLENARNYIQKTASGVAQVRVAQIGSQFFLPDSAHAMFGRFRKTLQQQRDSNGDLLGAHLLSDEQAGDLNPLFEEAHRRVESVPSIPAAGLRVLLIAIGLFWLFLGPIAWGKTDPPTGLGTWIPFGAIALLVVIGVGVIYSYTTAVSRAVRALELARDRVLELHLVQLCRALVEGLHGIGNRVVAAIDASEQAIEALADELARDSWGQESESRRNRQPLFDDDAVDGYFASRIDSVIGRTQQRFVETMEDSPLKFDPNEWRRCLRESAISEVERCLTTSRFDEFVKHVDPRRLNRAELVQSVVREARVPPLGVESEEQYPRIMCWLPESWKADLAGLENVHTHALPSRNLIAVSVHPLRAEE